MKKLILFAVLSLGTFTYAAAQKFGHADFGEIIGLLPERAKAEKEVQDLQKKLEARLNSMIETYQGKITEFETDTAMAPSVRRSLQGEIQDLQGRIQEFQQTATTEIQNKQNELMSAMFKRVQDAAQAVGKSGDYTYIFDSGSDAVLYAGGEDVTGQIKTQLGI